MKAVITILLGLKLERIQLSFVHSEIIGDWEWFPIAFRTAFVACISKPYMKEICLEDIPLSSFADCAGLKRLTLWRRVVPPLNRSFKFPQLEALELSDWKMEGSSHTFLSWALTREFALPNTHNTQEEGYTQVPAAPTPHLFDISGEPKRLLPRPR